MRRVELDVVQRPQRHTREAQTRHAPQQGRLTTDRRHDEAPRNRPDGEQDAEDEIRGADLASAEAAHQELGSVGRTRGQERSHAEPGAQHGIGGQPRGAKRMMRRFNILDSKLPCDSLTLGTQARSRTNRNGNSAST